MAVLTVLRTLQVCDMAWNYGRHLGLAFQVRFALLRLGDHLPTLLLSSLALHHPSPPPVCLLCRLATPGACAGASLTEQQQTAGQG